jgi:hypothetical protein
LPIGKLKIIREITAYFGEWRKPAGDFKQRVLQAAHWQQRLLDLNGFVLFALAVMAAGVCRNGTVRVHLDESPCRNVHGSAIPVTIQSRLEGTRAAKAYSRRSATPNASKALTLRDSDGKLKGE